MIPEQPEEVKETETLAAQHLMYRHFDDVPSDWLTSMLEIRDRIHQAMVGEAGVCDLNMGLSALMECVCQGLWHGVKPDYRLEAAAGIAAGLVKNMTLKIEAEEQAALEVKETTEQEIIT